jgi:hypothetical protein
MRQVSPQGGTWQRCLQRDTVAFEEPLRSKRIDNSAFLGGFRQGRSSSTLPVYPRFVEELERYAYRAMGEVYTAWVGPGVALVWALL